MTKSAARPKRTRHPMSLETRQKISASIHRHNGRMGIGRHYPFAEGETVPATFEDIADWARLNGVAWRSWDDLAAVNHARSLRLAPPLLPFERHWPVKGRFG